MNKPLLFPAGKACALDSLKRLERQPSPNDTLGTEGLRWVLSRMPWPENHQWPPFIHVAGTNGKGSVCAMAESILLAAQWKVGCFISPHLWSIHERVRINGCPVDDARLSWSLEIVGKTMAKHQAERSLTRFELLCAAGLWLFAQESVEAAIMETGLGGRLDATNVLPDGQVRVITTIALDHQEYLGNTIQAIAGEKAGIIHAGDTVITTRRHHDTATVHEVLRRKCNECQAVWQEATPKAIASPNNHWQLAVTHPPQSTTITRNSLPSPALLGIYQHDNAALAVHAVDTLIQRCGRPLLDDSTIAKGLATVYWPGRMQAIPLSSLLDAVVTNDEDDDTSNNTSADTKESATPSPVAKQCVWLDAAHNPSGALTLCQTVQSRPEMAPPYRLILGMLQRKNLSDYLDALALVFPEVVLVPVPAGEGQDRPATPNSSSSAENLHYCHARFFLSHPQEWQRFQCCYPQISMHLVENIGLALREEAKNPARTTIIAGSLYLVGFLLGKAGMTTPDKTSR